MLHHMLRAAAGRDRIPTDGLVAWYTMDNISGSTLIDEMGNYNGTINGATQTTGVIGQALNFDGSNDYVNCGTAAGSTMTGSFAVSFWLDPLRTSSDVYIAKYNSAPALFEFGQTSGAVFFRVGTSGGNVLVLDSSLISSYSEPFLHLVGRYNSSTSVIEIWVNGSLKNNRTSTVVSTSAINHPLWIGARSFPGANAYAQCNVDQVRLYDQYVEDDGIVALYNEGA